MSTNSESVSIPVKKFGATVQVSAEQIFEQQASRFPRKAHMVTHPITEAERAEYADLKRRWKKARKWWFAVSREAEKRRWGTTDGGYEWEPAKLEPLTPRTEWIYEETVEEHRSRVKTILDYHRQTGEWLEEPQKTVLEMMYEGIYRSIESSSPTLNALILGLAVPTEES